MSLAGLVLFGSIGRAQETVGFDAHGFHPAAQDGDLRDPLVVERPGPFVQGDWFLSGLAEYARSPLVRVMQFSSGTEELEVVVDNLVALNLSAGVALHDRIRLDVAAPVFALSTNGSGDTLGPVFGDVRATAMLVAVRPRPVSTGGGFGLALVGHLDAPTGAAARFLGQRDLAGGARLAATYERRAATVSGEFGWQFNPALPEGTDALWVAVDGSPLLTDTLLAGLAFGVTTSEAVGLTLELVATPHVDGLRGAEPFPAESLLSLRTVTQGGGFWTFGAAAGLTGGPGVAAFRLFVGGGFADRAPFAPPDSDPVGSLRTTDACPLEEETVNGFKDDDGCPDRLGTLFVDTRFRGEPRSVAAEVFGPDGHQSVRIGNRGLSLDAVPGSQWTVKAMEGCLFGEATALASEGGTRMVVTLETVHDARLVVEVVDPTGKPVPDAAVTWSSALPDCVPPGNAAVDKAGQIAQDLASGTHHLVVTAPLYGVHEEDVTLLAGDDRRLVVQLEASKLVIEKQRIRILEKVQFDSGRSVIRPESYDLLSQVAAVLITNPHLGRVEVAGHTDNQGSDPFNLQLSADRAAAVRTWLIKAGVSEDRLLAVGYGETKPIDSNRTDDGRENNRRVEFNLVDAPADGGAEE